MNFVVYPVYKKKTYSENKNLVQALGTGQNKTSANKRKTKIIPDYSKSKEAPKQKMG